MNLVHIRGEWKILSSTKTIGSVNGNCFASRGNILFSQQGERPSSDGWYDHQRDKQNVELGVYALEECVIYQGAYIDANFDHNTILQNGNMSSCYEGLPLTYSRTFFLLTTQTKSNEVNKIYCRYIDPNRLNRGKMTLSIDEKASILITNRNCNNPLNIINISEALVHNNTNLEALDDNKEGLPLAVIIGAGVVGTLLMVLLVVVVICYCYGYGCFDKKKSKNGDGNYGTASIDNNPQYGQKDEYYHYHYEQTQTRVVDDNEMYGIYGKD